MACCLMAPSYYLNPRWLNLSYCIHMRAISQEMLEIQYIQRNMHTALALLCFVVLMYWLIYPYPSGLLHWHCGNLTIATVPAKQPWWIWVNASCEFVMNDYITTTKQSTTKPCANFLGYTVSILDWWFKISNSWLQTYPQGPMSQQGNCIFFWKDLCSWHGDTNIILMQCKVSH